MKILVIGSKNNNSIERYYLQHLSQHNDISHVEFYGAHDVFLNYYQRNVVNKFLYRFKLSKILYVINSKIKKIISAFKPDVLLVFKGMEIFPDTLQWIKKKSVFIVNYNTDNPFVFSGRGSGNINIKKSISLYDLFISYDKEISELVKNKFAIDTFVLPFAFENVFNKSSSFSVINKLCFIGNEDKERLMFINQLANKGVPIDLFGYWKKKKLHQGINYCGKLENDNLFEYMSRYRVQLNLLRSHNRDSHNMRTFEIPAAGSIQLAPFTDDHLSFFESDKEIFLFTDVNDCFNQINKILSFEKVVADQHLANSRSRLLNSNYSYIDRTISLVEVIKNKYEQKVR